MRKRWKRLAAILGAAMLVVCQNGVIQVRAEEAPVTEESVQKEGTGDKENDPQKTEDDADESRGMAERTAQVSAVTNLRWENGYAVFYNPNTDKVRFEIHIFKDGSYPEGKTTTHTRASADSAGDVTVNLNYCFSQYGDGSYTYKVVTFADGVEMDHRLDGAGIPSDESSAYPDKDNPSQDGQEILPVTEAEWSDDGWRGHFVNPNEKDAASYVAFIYRDGMMLGGYYDGLNGSGKGEQVTLYLENYLDKTGEYTFEVETRDKAGNIVGTRAVSGVYSYTKPEKQLSTPQDISWDKEGIFSCKISEEEDFAYLSFRINYPGTPMFGAGDDMEGVVDGYFTFDLNEYLKNVFDVTPESGAMVWVRAVSKDITTCSNSAWSYGCVFDGGSSPSGSSSSSGDTSDGSDAGSSSSDSAPGSSTDGSSDKNVVHEVWRPGTPDEMKRYAAYSSEKVSYTADASNSYPVTIQNAMQGKMCFDSLETVLDGWAVGRTYNIFPSAGPVYKMDSKARVTLNIPKTLQAAGREFKMVCVTENGQPVILEDLDTNAESVTFETNIYYAFALIYKDAAVAQ